MLLEGIISGFISAIVFSIIVYCYKWVKSIIRGNIIVKLIKKGGIISIKVDDDDYIQGYMEFDSLKFQGQAQVSGVWVYENINSVYKDREIHKEIGDRTMLGIELGKRSTISSEKSWIWSSKKELELRLKWDHLFQESIPKYKILSFNIEYTDFFGNRKFMFVILNEEESKKIINHIFYRDLSSIQKYINKK